MTLDFDLLPFADMLWRSALVLTVGWVIIKLIRQKPAALRYEVAVITMAAALAVPVLHWALPGVAIIPTMPVVSDLSPNTLAQEQLAQQQALGWERESALSSGSVLDDKARDTTPGSVSDNRMVEALGFLVSEVRSMSVWQLIFLVWMAGVLAILAHAAIGRLRLAAIWKSSVPVAHADWDAVLEEAGDRVFLTRSVAVREMDGIQSPMTWGVLSPKLLIPSGLHGWLHERKLNAVMHELVHIRRRDAIHDGISSLVLALGWFNPFAWMMRSEVKAAREASCDAEVLGLGAQPEEYAHMLIDVAKGMRSSGRSMNVAMSMARPTQLEGRVLSVLNYAPRTVSPLTRHASFALMAVVVLFTSAATMAPLEESTGVVGGDVASKEKVTDRDGQAQERSMVASANAEPVQTPRESIPMISGHSSADSEAETWAEAESNPLGDLFAVAGIKLADAVLQEVGQSLDEIDWNAILEDSDWDIVIDDPESIVEEAAEFERSLDRSSESDLDGTMGRLSERLQSAIIYELEKTIRENPGTDKSRRARKALIAIESDAAKAAMKRLGIVPLR